MYAVRVGDTSVIAVFGGWMIPNRWGRLVARCGQLVAEIARRRYAIRCFWFCFGLFVTFARGRLPSCNFVVFGMCMYVQAAASSAFVAQQPVPALRDGCIWRPRRRRQILA